MQNNCKIINISSLFKLHKSMKTKIIQTMKVGQKMLELNLVLIYLQLKKNLRYRQKMILIMRQTKEINLLFNLNNKF